VPWFPENGANLPIGHALLDPLAVGNRDVVSVGQADERDHQGNDRDEQSEQDRP
jgi:hypothetical protein